MDTRALTHRCSRRSIRYLCCLIGFLLISSTAHAHTQVHARTHPHVEAETDYFAYVTLFSQGRITRFTEMPIQVYISPVLTESSYLPEIRHAMQAWETASDGVLRFQETTRPHEADIRVSWGYTGMLTDFQDTRLGSAELTRRRERPQRVDPEQRPNVSKAETAAETTPAFTVEVILMLESDATIGELSQAEMRTVCLHEFGHAIGLWGHSPHPVDISYPTANAQVLSERDVATLRRLYQTPPDTPQHAVAMEILTAEIAEKPHADLEKRLRSHYLLGTVALDKGDTAAAIASFQTCRELKPQFQPALEKLIQAYHETGETQAAIALLEERVSEKPSPADYNTLGIFYYERREAERAIQMFEKALRIAPYHKAARRNLHQLLRAKGFKALTAKDFQTATATFERVLQMEPLDAPTYQLMGNGYAHAGQFEKAIRYYQRAMDLNPVDALTQQNFAQCYNNYGVSLRHTGDWDGAIAAYRNAMRLMPTLHIAKTNLSDAFTRKAEAHREGGELDAAIAAYRELQKLHPQETHILNLLGELYLEKEDYAAALSAFQQVYTATPSAPHALHNLIAAYHHYARSLSAGGDDRAAIRLLEAALRLVPTDLNLRLSLATAYQAVEDYERAALELSRVLAQAPENAQARTEQINLRIRRGNTLMQKREYGAALAEFQAIPMEARDREIHNTIGYLCLMTGAFQQAFIGFQTVLASDRLNTPAFRNLLSLESQLVRRRGDKRDAETLTQVRCLLVETLMHRKQPAVAVEKYRQSLKSAPETMDRVVIETGVGLAKLLQQYGDSVNREKVLEWVAVRRGN